MNINNLIKSLIKEILSEALVYDEGPRGKFSGPPPTEWSEAAVMRGWARHVENLHTLLFFRRNPKSSIEDRLQADEELKICRRKLKYFESLPNFNKRVAEEMQNKIIASWRAKSSAKGIK